MKEEKKQEVPKGPISVTADITPISHEKVEKLDASQWGEMTTTDLFKQRLILQQRIDACARMGNLPMHQQLTQGMLRLNAVLLTRDDDDMRLV